METSLDAGLDVNHSHESWLNQPAVRSIDGMEYVILLEQLSLCCSCQHFVVWTRTLSFPSPFIGRVSKPLLDGTPKLPLRLLTFTGVMQQQPLFLRWFTFPVASCRIQVNNTEATALDIMAAGQFEQVAWKDVKVGM